VPELLLGPLVRHAGEDECSVWVETDGACEVAILGSRDRTFSVEGHHYALVRVTGLAPDAATPYEVHLDGERVWPLAGEPPSVLRTHARDAEVRIVFGSCRVAAPHEPPYSLRKDEDPRGREVDALRAFALRMRSAPPEEWPHALLMLGDQVYADEVHPAVEARIAGEEVESYADYAKLYRAAWGEPVIRWLLSTVPSAMIFDDHDVHDDWNTSRAWVEDIRRTDWWRERIVAAFSSYLVYQHLGNLSPAALEELELYRELREAPDPTERLRAFARAADEEVAGKRWSFCWDIGPSRVVMIDSRAGRVLEPGGRAMVDADEWAWITDHATGDVDHLLIGTSLPVVLGPALHHVEAWNEALADGAWGRLAARASEKLRRALDLEHWPAFHASYRAMCGLLRDIGAGRRGAAPATICVLSGDVHHAYLAQIGFRPGDGVRSAVWQAVCSPFRNPLDTREQRTILAGWTRAAGAVARALARAAGVPDPEVGWRLAHDRPWFNNQVAMLEMEGRRAVFRLEKAVPGDRVRMEDVFSHPISANAEFARP
jgi:PhoD-like phosphatase